MVARVAFAPLDTNAQCSADGSALRKHQQDIRDQVEQKCRDIQRQAEDAVMALEQELQVQLMKIPRKVRAMSLKEFREEFNGDIQAVLLDGKKSAIAQLLAGHQSSAPKTVGKSARKGATGAVPTPSELLPTGRSARKRPVTGASLSTEDQQNEGSQSKRGRTEMTTPAPSTAITAARTTVPSSAARIAAPGEVVYSQSGSPLLLPPTVMQGGAQSRVPNRAAPSVPPATSGPTLCLTTVSRARTAARTAVANVATGRKARGRKAARVQQAVVTENADDVVMEVAHGLTITTDDGQQIPLDSGLAHLPVELQQAAAKQLQSLKGLVDGLLSQTAQLPAAVEPSTAPSPGAPSTSKLDCPCTAVALQTDLKVTSELQKGKCLVMLAGAGHQEKFSQAIPGRQGLFIHVAKVMSRTESSVKLLYYATDGEKWTEVRGGGRTAAIEERELEGMGGVIAVFDALTKKERKLPDEVMQAVQAARLEA